MGSIQLGSEPSVDRPRHVCTFCLLSIKQLNADWRYEFGPRAYWASILRWVITPHCAPAWGCRRNSTSLRIFFLVSVHTQHTFAANKMAVEWSLPMNLHHSVKARRYSYDAVKFCVWYWEKEPSVDLLIKFHRRRGDKFYTGLCPEMQSVTGSIRIAWYTVENKASV
jgi:hypothetical protein